MEAANKFPEILKMLLSEHKMTRADLGNTIGMKSNTVSMWCLGRYEPTIETLIKIAKYFDISVDFLLTGENSTNVATRDELGLSDVSLKLLQTMAQKEHNNDIYFKWLSYYVDRMLSDGEFWTAFKNAIDSYHEQTGIYSDYEEYVTDRGLSDGKSILSCAENYAAYRMAEYFTYFFGQETAKYHAFLNYLEEMNKSDNPPSE